MADIQDPNDSIGPVIVEPTDAYVDYYIAPTGDTAVASDGGVIVPDGYYYDWTRGTFEPIPDPDVMDSVAKINTTVTTLQAGDPLPYVFGETTVAPQIITVYPDGDYLYVDYLLSVGECESIDELYQGGASIGKPTDAAKYEYFLGASGQSASTLLTAAIGSYDTLDNLCHFVVKLRRDESMDFKVRMKGIKTRDPRLSPVSTAYSANPALALGRVLEDLGYTVDDTSLSSAADYCDEDVSGAKRWQLHLPIQNRQTGLRWIDAISKYASCFVSIDSGTATFVIDKPVTTSPIVSRTVTSENMVSGSAKTEKVGVSEVPEQVTVMYREEDGTQRTATVGTGNPGQRTRINMPGFKSYTMARRKATEVYNLARADLRHEHIAHDEALADSVGDIHSITYAPHGLSSKWMRLVDIREVDRARYRRVYREYDEALYSDSVFAEPSRDDTDLASPNSPPDGPAATVIEELFQDETATTYSRLKISFTGLDWPYAQAYKVTAVGEQNVLNTLIANDGAGETHTVYTAALKQGVTYTIKVWVQSTTGVLSETPSETTATALGKLLPPEAPTGLTAYEAGTLVAMSWNAAVEIDGDLRGYQIRRLADADYTGITSDWEHPNVVTIAKRVDATTFLTAAQPAGDYWYMVKAIDNAGQFSTDYAAALVTVTADAGSVSTNSLTYGALTNAHAYTIDGDSVYVITSTGETWASRFGDTSPLATWADAVTSSPAERWGGDLVANTSIETEIWALGSNKSGNWWFDTSNITLLGGTQGNTIELGDNSSPISWTVHSGNTVQAAGYNFKAVVSTTDSPASAGDGLHMKFPLSVSYTGKIVDQEGTATIADTSPLDNPKAITFPTGYSSAPDLTLTLLGSAPLVCAADNITATGFDLYIWDLSGNLAAGSVAWSATGA